jgi:long-chain fatty acid transport protein
MKNLITGLILLVAVSLIFTNQVYTGGFQINEHGAKAMGMGGAFTAQASDPSAIFFNPAGLGFQKGINVLLGTTLIFPSTKFTGPTPSTKETKMESQIFYPSNLYATYAMDNGLSFGLGVYSPYGLGTEWPADWVGNRISVKTDLKSFYINPTVAYRVMDDLAIGVGFSYVISNVELSFKSATYSSLAPPTPSAKLGNVNLKADGTGFNFNAGIIYQADKNLKLGVAYRHSTEIDYSGDAKFTDMQALTSFFPGGSGKTTITLPSNLTLGASVNVSPEFVLNSDIQFVGWSSYDSLIVDIAKGPNFPLTGQPLQKGSASGKEWKNAMLFRVGGEYQYKEFAFRLGYIYDVTPQPDEKVEPMLPDANRSEFTLGIGYKISENLHVDAAYQLILFEDRKVEYSDIPLNGIYKSNAHLFGINVGYQF